MAPSPNPPRFIAQQRAFTAYLRDPAAAPPPADVAARRMQVYRELLYNNVDNSLSACFPVLKAILGEARWDETVARFFAQHRCRTPIYRRLPAEFLDWLALAADARALPPFARELAHYEWIELALTIDPARVDAIAVDPRGDLLAGVPVLNPVVRALEYAFPVHRLCADYAPNEPPPTRTHLLVYRNRRDDVRFTEINALTAQLLDRLRDATVTGDVALDAIAAANPSLDRAVVRAGGAAILNDMRARDVVLGTRI